MNGQYGTDRPSTERPKGPRRRPSLPRMGGYEEREASNKTQVEMSKRKGKSKNISMNSSSSPAAGISSLTPVTPIETLYSPESNDEIRKRRGGTHSPGIYPKLPDSEDSQVDESYTSTPRKSNSRSFNDTQTSKSSKSDSSFDEGGRFSNETTSPLLRHEKKPPLKNQTKGNGSNSSYTLGCLAFVLVVIPVIYVLFFGGSSETNKDKMFDIQYLISNITNLKRLFPSQDQEIWEKFGSGILDVQSKNHRPGIFVLLSDHNETANCLAKRVAEVARDTLHGTGAVTLDPNKLENDIGKVLNLMEDRMKKTKVAVFPDILSFKPQALQAFHDICDEYNTLVSEAVYIFSMNSDFHSESDTLTAFAEKQLTERFSNDIRTDTLGPLIIRITAGNVLLIKKEEDVPCSE